MFKNTIRYVLIASLSTTSAFALYEESVSMDVKLSGYATFGGSISDKGYTYQKYIDDEGTLRSDTKIGGQLELKFTEQFSAMFQGKYAQSLKDDERFDATLDWGFLAYKPSNSWLLRAGKIRIPFYLHTQNLDVGVTYTQHTLPYELYALSDYDEGLGGIVTYDHYTDEGLVSVEAFYVEIDTTTRVFNPATSQPFYVDSEYTLQGLSISYEDYDYNRLKGTFTHTEVSDIDVLVVTLGAQYNFLEDCQLTAEYMALLGEGTGKTIDVQGGYISVMKRIQKWNPYITLAASYPSAGGQKSAAVGLAYGVTPLQKIKAEYMHVKTGSTPNGLIDIPASQSNAISNENINIFSLSYNIAF